MMEFLISVSSRVATFAVNRFRLSYPLLLCVLVLTLSSQAFGQNATVVGTITHPSGAAVANATVTITHNDTAKQAPERAGNGRRIYQLAQLTPGASSQITGFVNTPVGGNSNVEFNGMRQNHNIYLLDGGEDDDRGGAGGMSIAPSTDAIAEFPALTSNYSADYGLSSPATMTMVLKSGTSTLHASA